MKQLFFIAKEKLEWRDVPAPALTSSRDALVRPFAVAKCDLDDIFLFNHTALKLALGRHLW